VSRPTMTVYSPKGKNTGAAVVVFPGGGYQILAIDLEGTEVCDWLTSKRITCVLWKYRVPGNELYPKSASYPKSGPYPESPMALEDAQRTVGLVRFHAAERHIDPHKIGVLGFSSRGALVGGDQHIFREASLLGCRCRRQRKLPPGLCGGYLSWTSVGFRGGMGR
jgi:acetyl esterase/lipase